MSSDRAREQLFEALEAACQPGPERVAPGLVALVWRDGAMRYHEAHGVLATHPAAGVAVNAPVERDTIYDLASLTKVLATTTLVARAHARGDIDLDAPVPAPFDRACPGATLEDLLTHRAGLEAHREFFVGRTPGEVQALIADVLGTPRRGPPRADTVYSDLGFILLGAWLEQRAGQPLDQLFDREVARPLYLDQSRDKKVGYRLPQLAYRRLSREGWLAREFETKVAPTEVYDRGLHPDGPPSHFEIRRDCPLAHGQVHDDNALVLDGVGGHAGLFGHAEAVLDVARAWLRADALGLTPATRDLFWRADDTRPRRIGWDAQSPDGSGSTAGVLGDDAVGHLGFTGTSLWIDPQRDAIYILLSNRVHPTRAKAAEIRALRRRFHALAVAL